MKPDKAQIKKAAKYFLFFFGIGTAIGIMNSAIVVSTLLTEGEEFKIIYPIIGEFTGTYSFALLLPIMLYVFRRYPISRHNIASPLFKYILVFIPVGLLHVLFMYYSRQFINDIAGWGRYDYGKIPYRIIMEYIKMSTGIMTAGLIYHLILSFREKEKEKVRLARLEEQLSKTRLEVLKSQLNPHFLFNTLNMISSAMYDDINIADKMISNLSAMLRVTLQTSGRDEYTLKEELEFLKLYIDIMKARFNDKLEISSSVDPDSLKSLVPHFLLQPLIENSIKHGMESLEVTRVNVAACTANGRVIINVTDNGPGIAAEKSVVLTKGVGLSNTIERLEKIYNGTYKFDWVNLEKGLKITIDIPYKEGKTNE